MSDVDGETGERPRPLLLVGLAGLLLAGPALLIGGGLWQAGQHPVFDGGTASAVPDDDLAWYEPLLERPPARPEAVPSWKVLVALPASGGMQLLEGEDWVSYPELDEDAFVAALRPYAESTPSETGPHSDFALYVRLHRDAPVASLARLEALLGHPDLGIWKLGAVVLSGPERDVSRFVLCLPLRDVESTGTTHVVRVEGEAGSETYAVADRTGLSLDALVAWAREQHIDGWGGEPTRLDFAPEVTWGAVVAVLSSAVDPVEGTRGASVSYDWGGGCHVHRN